MTRSPSPLAWRPDFPGAPTRGSLTSPSHLVRNRTLGPPLENHPEPSPVIAEMRAFVSCMA